MSRFTILFVSISFVACGGSDPAPASSPTLAATYRAPGPIPTQPTEIEEPAPEAESPAPQPKPPGMEPDVRLEPQRGVVFFAFDSAELSRSAKLALQADIDWLAEDPDRRIIIHGYTDDVGTATYNLTLGNARAEAVRAYLADKGIDAVRIQVVSHGESGPEMPDDLERRAVYVSDTRRASR